MWTQIVASLVLLVLASFVVQAVLPRTRGRAPVRRNYVAWDVAPLVGFFGLILVGLSLAEAVQQGVLAAWAWGGALGLILSLSAALTWAYRSGHTDVATATSHPRKSILRGAWQFVRTFGLVSALGLMGLNLAGHLIGAPLEVFVAGATGVVLIVSAILVFSASRSLGHP